MRMSGLSRRAAAWLWRLVLVLTLAGGVLAVAGCGPHHSGPAHKNTPTQSGISGY
jgi:hypothetical protein